MSWRRSPARERGARADRRTGARARRRTVYRKGRIQKPDPPFSSVRLSACPPLLLTRSVGIGPGLVYHYPVIERRDSQCSSRHQAADVCHLVVVDVLRLVGDLVVVAVAAA